MQESINQLQNELEKLVNDFRVAAGARNVEIILSSKNENSKCDITIRY